MEERNSLSLGAHAGNIVQQLDPRFAAPGQSSVEIVHREAYVMNARPPLCHESAYRRGLVGRLEELHQRAGGIEAANPGSVRVCERDLGEAKDLSEKRGRIAERADGNSDVGDLRAAWG